MKKMILVFSLIVATVSLQNISADAGDVLLPTALGAGIGGAVGGGKGAGIGAAVGLGTGLISSAARDNDRETVYVERDYPRREYVTEYYPARRGLRAENERLREENEALRRAEYTPTYVETVVE